MKQKRLRETIIRVKITEIVDCVTLVREHLPESVEDFILLGLVKDGIYKRIEFAIEDIFDICAIVNTDLELGVPGEDDDILDNLVNKNIISKQMQEKIHAMKGFRNIVVHRYGKIDDRLAFDLLTAHLNDFADFIDEIEKFLQNGHL
jgi:uncharacterized protein YutE (UPF0331/DUF86 family)